MIYFAILLIFVKIFDMIISHIVAVSKNFVIGNNNRLPWKMPSDARYFHEVTMGHVVVMGRKNYEANKKALPGRTNIVITRNNTFKPQDAIIVLSINEALDIARELKEEEVFIVGGGEIYSQTMDIIDRIYITLIDTIVEGDTFYPEINISDYKIVSEIKHSADSKNPHDWTYYVLETNTNH
jgi:dihydrofolate reductase